MVPFPDAATETASCGDFQKYSVHGKADVLLSHFSLSLSAQIREHALFLSFQQSSGVLHISTFRAPVLFLGTVNSHCIFTEGH